MNVAWKTDTGSVRTNNEDRILVDEKHGIFLLADGMGGHNAGEIASDLAVKEAYSFILKEMPRDADEQVILGIMEDALCYSHHAVQAKAATDVQLNGMGTTLVELYIQGSNAYICHAGDSRAYLFRNVLQRITRDHTVADAYVQSGHMESDKVPPRLWHVLTKAVGTSTCPVPDKKHIDLTQGDILLVCSDGLTDMLTDDEIQHIVIRHRDAPSDMVESLARDANSKGGKDNISVISIGI